MRGVNDPVYGLVAFYDLLEFPLTSVEMWRLLRSWGEKVSLREVLEQAENHNELIHTNGFFTLRGREWLVRQRAERYSETEQQLRDAWKWLTAVASMPGIRAVFLCNTYGLSNPSSESDIDLYIVTKPGRIWTGRLFTTTLFRLLNRRPDEDGHGHAGTVCLSFYGTSRALRMNTLEEGEFDIYFDFWKQWLVPIYDPDRLHLTFAEKNDSLPRPVTRRRNLQPLKAFQWLLELVPIEPFARALQWRMFPEAIHTQANLSTHVVVNNSLLKFHTHDGRKGYKENWQRRLQAHDRAREESVV